MGLGVLLVGDGSHESGVVGGGGGGEEGIGFQWDVSGGGEGRRGRDGGRGRGGIPHLLLAADVGTARAIKQRMMKLELPPFSRLGPANRLTSALSSITSSGSTNSVLDLG